MRGFGTDASIRLVEDSVSPLLGLPSVTFHIAILSAESAVVLQFFSSCAAGMLHPGSFG